MAQRLQARACMTQAPSPDAPSPDAPLVPPAKPSLPINLPHVLAAVEAAFSAYEVALTTNDVPTLEALFLQTPEVVRYGAGENLYGPDEIAAFRRARPSQGLMRTLERTQIITYGEDFATAWTLFRRDSAPGKIGRQSQVWVRTPQGWRVAAAHVSLIPDPDAPPA
jgi:hypothetical protein